MFNRKSDYALNKKDISAIVYIDSDKHIIRLTREDFTSEDEFLRWKTGPTRITTKPRSVTMFMLTTPYPSRALLVMAFPFRASMLSWRPSTTGRNRSG